MGYDLHITKKDFWADEEGIVIQKEEWIKYVSSDPDISPDKNNTENDFLVKDGDTDWPIWYDPSLGEIYTKNPSDKAIKKLKIIANELNAKLQGDDGELY